MLSGLLENAMKKLLVTLFTEATTDGAGAFDINTTVRRMLSSPFGPGATDCAVTPCTLVAQEFDGFGDSASATLGFDPNSVAPPPPVLKASPDDGLHDGDTVDVRGSKFTPNSDIVVLECAGAVDPNSNVNCDFSSPTRIPTRKKPSRVLMLSCNAPNEPTTTSLRLSESAYSK